MRPGLPCSDIRQHICGTNQRISGSVDDRERRIDRHTSRTLPHKRGRSRSQTCRRVTSIEHKVHDFRALQAAFGTIVLA